MNDTTQDLLMGRRWPWLAAGILLLAAAAAAAAAVHLYWLPCRGSILSGTIIGALTGRGDYSDACLQRMDDGSPLMFPDNAPLWGSELTLSSMVVAALAWLVLVLGVRLTPSSRLLAMAAVAPVLAFTVTAVLVPDAASPWWFSLLEEPLAIVFLVAVWARTRTVGTGTALCLGLVLWGATAFGGWHQWLEFSFMLNVNTSNWDVPPGSGSVTVGVLAASGLCALAVGILGRRGIGSDEIVLAGALRRMGRPGSRSPSTTRGAPDCVAGRRSADRPRGRWTGWITVGVCW